MVLFTSLRQKLIETLYFLIVTPYSGSFIHNGPVYEFLWGFKNFKFSLKIHRLAYFFSENR
jgi:hypothetical protein